MTDGQTILLVVVLLAVYFLPCIVAGLRDHPNGAAISVVNLFLGWTLLGWVVALAWSLLAIDKRTATPRRSSVAGQPRPREEPELRE